MKTSPLQTQAPFRSRFAHRLAVILGGVALIFGATTSAAFAEKGDLTTIPKKFATPRGIVSGSLGELIVVDKSQNQIKRIDGNQKLAFLSGTGAVGRQDGPAKIATFNNPTGIAQDFESNLYVADTGNNLIRKITADGTVSTLAGSGVKGRADGRGPGATLNGPVHIAVNSRGLVYISDTQTGDIRTISQDGTVTTLSLGIRLESTSGLAIDASDNVYIATPGSIWRLSSAHILNLYAGSGGTANKDRGVANGNVGVARLSYPSGLAVDMNGYVYVADFGNTRIRVISPQGMVSTLAGSGIKGTADANGLYATFTEPFFLAANAFGDVFVTDTASQYVRMIESMKYVELIGIPPPPPPSPSTTTTVLSLAANSAILKTKTPSLILKTLPTTTVVTTVATTTPAAVSTVASTVTPTVATTVAPVPGATATVLPPIIFTTPTTPLAAPQPQTVDTLPPVATTTQPAAAPTQGTKAPATKKKAKKKAATKKVSTKKPAKK
jgi:sugar lactone lactonase YvrE